jgi:hypothetical protein
VTGESDRHQLADHEERDQHPVHDRHLAQRPAVVERQASEQADADRSDQPQIQLERHRRRQARVCRRPEALGAPDTPR